MDWLRNSRAGANQSKSTIGPVAGFTLACSLLIFTKTLAVWTRPLGTVGIIGWSGFYLSALILVVVGIDALAKEPIAEDALEEAVAADSELTTETAAAPGSERLAS